MRLLIFWKTHKNLVERIGSTESMFEMFFGLIWSGDGKSPEKMVGCHENSFQQRLRSSNVLGCIWRIIIKPCTFKYFSVYHDHDIVDLYNLFVFIHVFDEGFVENEGSQIFMVHHHSPLWIFELWERSNLGFQYSSSLRKKSTDGISNGPLGGFQSMG